MIITKEYVDVINSNKNKYVDSINKYIEKCIGKGLYVYQWEKDKSIIMLSSQDKNNTDIVLGNKLYDIYSGYGKDYVSSMYSYLANDITKEFLDGYMRNGMCIVDSRHVYDRYGRYSIDGDVKTCNFCGKTWHKHIKMVEEWIADDNS